MRYPLSSVSLNWESFSLNSNYKEKEKTADQSSCLLMKRDELRSPALPIMPQL